LKAPASRAWIALACLLALGSLAAWPAPRAAIDWQPSLWFSQPWRAWTAATVHYSPLHLGANLAGLLLVAALGAVADLRLRSVAAWGAAWPLTQIGLLWRPELLHFGGLSGVLHAGVAVVAVHLIAVGPRQRRGIGLAILAVLVGKLLSESPWGPALRQPEGWDIAVAPFAHASGVACGLVCGGLAGLWGPRGHD
jgi:rhomboid family GlyGly-CTERM serine protease